MKKWKPFWGLVKETPFSKSKLTIAFVLSFISTAGALFIPLVMKNMVDNFSIEKLNAWVIAGIIFVFILQGLSSGYASYLLNVVGQNFVANLRDRLWKKILILPMSYFNKHRTGETLSRVTNDTGITKNFVSDHLAGFVTGVISAIGSFIILLIMDWKMTLVTFTVIPLCAIVMIPVGRRMYQISRQLQDETASFSTIITQVLSEMKLVKSSNSEKREYANGKSGIKMLEKLGVKEGIMQAIMGPMVMFVLMLILIAIIGYGGMRVSNGDMSAGKLVAFILYLFQIVMPITQIAAFFNQFQKLTGATERIIETLHTKEEDIYKGSSVSHLREDIHFKHVSFTYEQENDHALHHISFTLPAGKMTAIVGPSGGGKTTIFSMIERFYEPQDGDILLGTQTASQFSLHSWRSKIGYVSQESPLLAGSLRDNLTYGLDRDVSDDEIWSAIAQANANSFVSELQEGLETDVGERGSKLSGGQRQRIAIARAILRNPDVLMLDEATASLDSESEKAIQEALVHLMKDRTTLVIAHRLSTVVDADQLIFLEKGVVTGVGTHAELYESHPLYKKFADHQLSLDQ